MFKFSPVTYIHPRVREGIWQLSMPLAFLIIVLLFFPSRERFQFDSDEGVELMKAKLVSEGFSLYDEIWSDHPPLYTYMLVAGFKLFGYKVLVGRHIVLTLSCILIWASCQFLRMIWGNAHAIAGAVLLIILPLYMVLSVSAMLSVPNIAFAMLSLLALTKWHNTRQYHWLILSSIALGLSVLTKLLTGFLAPIFIVGLIISEYAQLEKKSPWYKLLIPSISWGLVFTTFVLVIGLILIGPENVSQLLEHHLAATDVSSFSDQSQYTITWHLKKAFPILLLALVGFIDALMERKYLTYYLFSWIVVAYLILSIITPIWDHHQLLITIPAALLAANAFVFVLRKVGRVIREEFSMNFKDFLQLVAIIGLLTMFFRLPDSLEVLELPTSVEGSGLGLEIGEERLLYIMENRAPKTRWVVTDLPMYAFRAGLIVPPNQAVISMKRIETGFLTDEVMLDTVREYLPEQVLLGRFEFPLLESYLAEDYSIIHETKNIKLYIRDDL